MHYFLGVDFGTSGVRAFVIDENNSVCAQTSVKLPPSKIINHHQTQNPLDWWNAFTRLLNELNTIFPLLNVCSICIDGTSGSVLLSDSNGEIKSPAYMYNDNANKTSAKKIESVAPDNHLTSSSSSSLAKCISLISDFSIPNALCLNQADWLTGCLLKRFDFSDENNSLKMGYDAKLQQWPNWMNKLDITASLPKFVFQAGDLIGQIAPSVAEQFGFNPSVKIIAGTTDSIAATIAVKDLEIGTAVSSLGSTLVIKIVSDKPIDDAKFGIYSHRFGDVWLVGGASNCGGAVLRQFFDDQQIQQLSNTINPNKLTGLDYYPLSSPGERFPINNPDLIPILSPRPNNDSVFFQAILEGIAKVEHLAYEKLVALGAPKPKKIMSLGGGSRNENWRIIREKICGIPIINAEIDEAAYGAALLAKQGFLRQQ